MDNTKSVYIVMRKIGDYENIMLGSAYINYEDASHLIPGLSLSVTNTFINY